MSQKLFNMPHLLSILYAQIALGMALLSQYGFGLHPCDLCIMQRYPYVVAIVAGLVGLLAWKKRKKAVFGVMLIAGLLSYLTTAAIAAYHAAVEYGWVQGPAGCTPPDTLMGTLEDLYAKIMSTPAVTCDEPAFVFLLSMAGWNFIYAFNGAIYMSYHAKQHYGA